VFKIDSSLIAIVANHDSKRKEVHDDARSKGKEKEFDGEKRRNVHCPRSMVP
jgi:hypothetical protein